MDASLCICCLSSQRIEGGIDFLELELQKIVRCHVGTGKHISLGPLQEKNSKTSQPLSGLSSPSFHLFKIITTDIYLMPTSWWLPHPATDYSVQFIDGARIFTNSIANVYISLTPCLMVCMTLNPNRDPTNCIQLILLLQMRTTQIPKVQDATNHAYLVLHIEWDHSLIHWHVLRTY